MEKQRAKKIQVRFPLDIWERMHALAYEHGRSLNGEVVWALRSYLAAQKGETASGTKNL
ncbi:MAG: Arc family DNA-binding protein [Ktedonobacteraceae bacterium]